MKNKLKNAGYGLLFAVFVGLGIQGTTNIASFDQKFRTVIVDTLKSGFNTSNTTGLYVKTTMVSGTDTAFNIGNDTLRFKNVKAKYIAAQDTSLGSFYIGNPTTNGSWRFRNQGMYLKFQRLVAGVWVTKDSIAP